MKTKILGIIFAGIIFAFAFLVFWYTKPPTAQSIAEVPEYTKSPYVVINGNVPNLSKEDGYTEFETYSNKDWLGRCGAAYANVSKYTMPKAKRESISHIKPTGWHVIKYDFIDGKYLYNRCHLIGYQLTGENDNDRNLITGTRYLNTQGMLPFENEVAEYVKETGHHVLYRVTPYYTSLNLLADGVQIEALSVEDDEIEINVYCYNVQPGVAIDYATGNAV